jgi:restriction system protein
MGRRSRRTSLLHLLVTGPWWLPLVLAVGSALFFGRFIPHVFASRVAFSALVEFSHSLAWIFASLFSVIGLVAYLRAQRASSSSEHDATSRLNSSRSTSRRSRHGRLSLAQTNSADMRSADDPMWTLPPSEWSIEALQQLEWKRFENLCAWYYEAQGFMVKTVSHGPDGGIDATLYKAGIDSPVAIVQCKAWNAPVKVDTVRALGGVMLAHGVRRGTFWSLTGYVGQPVHTFAADAGIQLLDGPAIVERLRKLDAQASAQLLARAFEGDYRSPTCVRCGVKMVRRQGSKPFWGCPNFANGCRVTLPGRVGR